MNKHVYRKSIRAIQWMALLLVTVTPSMICGQVPVITHVDSLSLRSDTVTVVKAEQTGETGEAGESWEVDQRVAEVLDSLTNNLASNENTTIRKETTPFKPNPKTATIASAIFPGLGQIYNRQYWKLPIVYGGLMGCLYAITWNNKTYGDYKDAYYSIMLDAKADPQSEHPEAWSDRWQIFVPGNIDPATRLHDVNFHNNLKRGKDYFRRYRELSWIIMVAVWGITVADAYVDAQMFDFDVSPDLSFQVTPLFIPESFCHARSYGFTVCINF